MTARRVRSAAPAGWLHLSLAAVAGVLAALTVLAPLVVSVQVTVAGTAAAHAELIGSSPPSGSRLDRSPTEVTLTFTEDVDLVDGGMRLLDSAGDEVTTPAPTTDGDTVHWPMPKDLPEGAYVASWRVISADSHPVAGAITFGVGVAPGAAAASTQSSAPWPVVAARLLGYAGFAIFLGAFVFLVACWPQGQTPPAHASRLPTIGLLIGVVASVAGLMLQGPYLAGLPMRDAVDTSLLAETGHTDFGAWMQVRGFVYLAMLGVLWGDAGARTRGTRWLCAGGALAAAVTFTGTGHAASSGSLGDRLVDGVHLLAAGTWVGGLVLLAAVLPRDRQFRDVRVEQALARFSRLALGSVVVLVLTGTLNTIIHLEAVADLWRSGYGRILLVKLAVVAAALAAAAFSRRLVQVGRSPWRSVRVEAVATCVVLLVTALLAMTPPPSSVRGSDEGTAAPAAGGPSAGDGGGTQPQQPATTTIEMNLGDGRSAQLHVVGTRTGGSQLHLELLQADGSPLPARRVELRLSLPDKGVGPFEVPMRREQGLWAGTFSFTLPGTWTVALTVEDQALNGTVTSGKLDITG